MYDRSKGDLLTAFGIGDENLRTFREIKNNYVFQSLLFPRVDFELAVWENRPNIFVWSDGEDPNDYSGKIIECSWLPDEKKWEYMRVRTDKDTPNAVRTYRKVSYKNVESWY